METQYTKKNGKRKWLGKAIPVETDVFLFIWK